MILIYKKIYAHTFLTKIDLGMLDLCIYYDCENIIHIQLYNGKKVPGQKDVIY